MMNTLSVFTYKGIPFFLPHELVRLEACSSYTRIMLTNERTYITSKVLKSYVPYLESMGFIRLNRTHLVNPEFINHVFRNGIIQMTDDTNIKISKQNKVEIYKRILYAYENRAIKTMVV